MSKTKQLPSVSPELLAKIETSDADVREFISSMNDENKRLNKRAATLEAANASLANQLDDFKRHKPPEPMSEGELKVKIVPMIVGEIRDASGWLSYCDAHGVNPDTALFARTPDSNEASG